MGIVKLIKNYLKNDKYCFENDLIYTKNIYINYNWNSTEKNECN